MCPKGSSQHRKGHHIGKGELLSVIVRYYFLVIWRSLALVESKHVSFVIIPGLNKMVCVIRNQDGDNEVVGKPVCECSNGKVANLNK